MNKIILLVALLGLLGCSQELSGYTEKEKKFIREIKKSVVYQALEKAQIPVVFMVCNNIKGIKEDALGVHRYLGKHHALAICMGRTKSIDSYLETLQHEAMHAIQFCAQGDSEGRTYFAHEDNVEDAKEWGYFSKADKAAKNGYKPENYKTEFEAYMHENKDFTKTFPTWIKEACSPLNSVNAREYFFGDPW